MTSERKIAANRANAQRSTGPRSTAGKLKSAQNALRHGLAARTIDPTLNQAAAELAAQLIMDDGDMAEAGALKLAEGLLVQARVAHMRQRAMEDAIESTDAALPYAVREALAAAEVAQKLKSMQDYDRRAAGSIRKQLRKLR